MRATVIILFACVALAALAVGNAAQLEKTIDDPGLSLADENVADRYKRDTKSDTSPLATLRRTTRSRRRRGKHDCSISCNKGDCDASCNYCKRCKCKCTWGGRPKCKCR
ncbi:hypothetical protein NP493_2129g00005 [Ridgeia piscesae]|uniref:Uncharacterized protein n=1 Tax=Ridgeia piscesae TaxID=27915 RepID=A0AAD9N5C6_RIDPI|nr:hypothetical protein NP493_2129g00005 [Ridgeia piscesae]